MKRWTFNLFLLCVSLLLLSCENSLNDYLPKNDSEKNIKALLNTYVSARNNGDIDKLAFIFHDKGLYIAGNGAAFTKSEIAQSDPEWWVQYGEVKLLNSQFKITGDEATISSTGKWGGVFKTPHIASLVKEDESWYILKIKTGN